MCLFWMVEYKKFVLETVTVKHAFNSPTVSGPSDFPSQAITNTAQTAEMLRTCILIFMVYEETRPFRWFLKRLEMTAEERIHLHVLYRFCSNCYHISQSLVYLTSKFSREVSANFALLVVMCV